MYIKISPNYEMLCDEVTALIKRYIEQNREAIVCIASGFTPIGVMDRLRESGLSGETDLSGCFFVGMDEWVGIPSSKPGSCRHQLDEKLFRPLGISNGNILYFDGIATDLEKEVQQVNTFLDSRGGFDILLAGVGTNGHIAMNEPGTSFDSLAHVSDLAESTILSAQKYFPASTQLKKGLTIGLLHFHQAKLPILMANGLQKRAIMKKILSSPPIQDIPATIIHTMPQVYVMMDQEAGGE